jgi:hypothetical protein
MTNIHAFKEIIQWNNGGPMFEFLFGLDTQLRQEKRRDKFNLTFFTPAEKPGARLGKKAVESLLSAYFFYTA